MVSIIGGDWWAPYDTEQAAPATPTTNGISAGAFSRQAPLDLSDPRLRRLATALSPAYMRVSDKWANSTFFQTAGPAGPPPAGFDAVLTAPQWQGVLDFSKDVGAKLMTSFAISPGVRNGDGAWAPTQAAKILDYTAKSGGTIAAAEFFNEPNLAVTRYTVTAPSLLGSEVRLNRQAAAADGRRRAADAQGPTRARGGRPCPAEHQFFFEIPPQTERRARYPEAAAEIIVEQGVSFVATEEVAARNGVDKRLGYRYFPNREAMLTALFEQQMREVTRRALAASPRQPTLRERVAANIGAWLELAAERGPLLSRLFSDQDVIPAVASAIGERAVRNWAVAIGNALDMPPPVAEVLARIYLAALRGAVEAVEFMPVAEVAAIYATACCAGMEAVAAGLAKSA